ncbi:MAG: DUF2461 domain-containing protein [Oscillospiraceae bacterium]|nr:DUF2461 domain-containing protein [Oscillospiraceae bacterium]
MFTGYTDKTLDFLWGIRFNNDRSWFADHKEEYLQHLYQPTMELGQTLYDRFTEKFPKLGLNLHVSRIYRDARRLYGKGPYKDHIWLTLRPENDVWSHLPVFWFEITPDGWSYGVGFWNASPQTMALLRRDIDEHPEHLSKLVRRLRKDGRFQLMGQDYARSKGEPSPLLTPWYNKKTLSIGCERPFDGLLRSPELPDVLLDGFAFLVPYYEYLKALCKTGLEDLK